MKNLSSIRTLVRSAAMGCIVASSFCLLTHNAAAADDAAKPYTQQKDVVVVQSHGVAIVMDIFTPTENSNGIGIVDVASGGWSSDRGKIKQHDRAQVYNIFCRRGYTMFAVRPGSSSRFSAHDMVNHLESAIGEIEKNADQYGIDPDRIAITGASAGGHLASLVAVRQKVKLVAAGVFFPPTDFLEYGTLKVDPSKNGRLSKIVRALAYPDRGVDLSEEEINEQMIAISPARQVTEGSPPFLLIHGDADPLVPLQQSQKLLAALKAKNVPAELIIKEGGGHPWLTIPVEVAKMADWFDKQYATTTVAAN